MKKENKHALTKTQQNTTSETVPDVTAKTVVSRTGSSMSVYMNSNHTEPDEAVQNKPQIPSIAELAHSAQLENEADQHSQQANAFSLMNTSCIPDSVYENLPQLLKNSVSVFDSVREKDVFLTGAITILSGCMNEVEGVYDSREVHANLNCFIVAPPASGKGVFQYAKMLGEAYHEKLLDESRDALRTYEAAIKNITGAGDAEGGNNEKPPFEILFIPGNSSSSAIIKHLMDSGGKGIFCETEADTLSNSLKQEWGNFSDLLRKAFHHENVSYSRKTSNEFYEIRKPRLSVAISGTPSQVRGLIPSAEDGLFSRFIFYVFSSTPQWKDVAPVENKPNLNMFFEEQSVTVKQMAEYLLENPFTFNLSQAQWAELNNEFTLMFNEVVITVGGDALSVIKRLGLILYRIAMVLTAINKFEQKSDIAYLECSDADFSTAMQLVKVYKEHAILMFSQLPQSNGPDNKVLEKFFSILPDNFKRADAITEGRKMELGVRTVDKYLNMLTGAKALIKPSYGQYSKKQ